MSRTGRGSAQGTFMAICCREKCRTSVSCCNTSALLKTERIKTGERPPNGPCKNPHRLGFPGADWVLSIAGAESYYRVVWSSERFYLSNDLSGGRAGGTRSGRFNDVDFDVPQNRRESE
jgi:hypothetical protein